MLLPLLDAACLLLLLLLFGCAGASFRDACLPWLLSVEALRPAKELLLGRGRMQLLVLVLAAALGASSTPARLPLAERRCWPLGLPGRGVPAPEPGCELLPLPLRRAPPPDCDARR